MRAVVLSIAAAGVAALGAVWACLPDLELGAATPFCGDGIIDPDAGEQCDFGPDAAAGKGDGSACSAKCQVTCASGLSQFTDPASLHCYFSEGEQSAAPDAATSCETNGAHVVRFASAEEVALVANGAATAPFWVGLELTVSSSRTSWLPLEPSNEPGWDSLCAGCFASIDAGASQIPVDQPGDRGFCVAGQKGAQPWSQSPCSGAVKSFARLDLCEREPVGTRVRACANGDCFTVAATQGRKSYLFVPLRKLAANDAAQACEKYGGRLVVFESREEREQVAHEVAGLASDFWIGMAADAYGVWRWDADGGLDPLPWGEQQPAPLDAGASGARAYVQIAPGVVDSELARVGSAADAGGEQHYVVCER